MIKVAEFVRDIVRTFLWFFYESLINIIYVMETLLTFMYNFVVQFVITSLYELLIDVYHILRFMSYEGCILSSTILLEIGKLLTNASEYLLIKAEQISGKRV